MRFVFLSLISLFSVACVSAQSAQPTPPCSAEAFRQFDFWLGNWDVTDTKGNLAGRNVITSEENGCLVLETWTSAKGGTGQSYNIYDPNAELWRQIWISPGFMIDYSGGLTATGSMRLVGEISYHSGGTFPFSGEWSPLDDGTVRQHFEQYDAQSDAWQPWFTGIYTKVEGEAD